MEGLPSARIEAHPQPGEAAEAAIAWRGRTRAPRLAASARRGRAREGISGRAGRRLSNQRTEEERRHG
jgi:hypothetical protein